MTDNWVCSPTTDARPRCTPVPPGNAYDTARMSAHNQRYVDIRANRRPCLRLIWGLITTEAPLKESLQPLGMALLPGRALMHFSSGREHVLTNDPLARRLARPLVGRLREGTLRLWHRGAVGQRHRACDLERLNPCEIRAPARRGVALKRCLD